MKSENIVGGGLAGLAAANYLACGGRRVDLYEKSEAWRGRARTVNDRGALFNSPAPRGGAVHSGVLGAHRLSQERLMTENRQFLWGLSYRMLGKRRDADDGVQETYAHSM